MKKIVFIFGVLFALALSVSATTWFPAKHTCPICNKENTYQNIGSYGSYIYQWESKYQYVYWPLTESQAIYCCPNCHFSAYMWDFDSIPESKIDTLTKFLATVKLNEEYTDYLDIPGIIKLEIAENVYKILERDKKFWCEFYRIIGYHYDQENNILKAEESRLISLNIARQMLTDSLYKGQEKEMFFIIAAMYKENP